MRSATPDWPPVPAALANGIADQHMKNEAVLENEVSAQSSNRDIGVEQGNNNRHNETALDSNDRMDEQGCGNKDVLPVDGVPGTGPGSKSKRGNDPHRSLPPIPGSENVSSAAPDCLLSWVTKSASVGPGPYIPRCGPEQYCDEIPAAHFYDDIDNIRKIAQERAAMIQRLQEENPDQESASVRDASRPRTSLGEMPDVIPVVVDVSAETGRLGESEVGHEDPDKKKKKKKKLSKDKKGKF